jgi:hypothetical protein
MFTILHTHTHTHEVSSAFLSSYTPLCFFILVHLRSGGVTSFKFTDLKVTQLEYANSPWQLEYHIVSQGEEVIRKRAQL